MVDVEIQERESRPHGGSPEKVLGFCNQIPSKLKVYLEAFNLKTPQDIFDFLQPKLATLENPYKILNLEKAAERLWNAWVNQETILIYGDYDLDGTSGIILLHDSLKALGFKNLHYFQPSKANDGYGLHAGVIQEFKSKHGIDVVVTVDVGITGNEACTIAKNLGVDVIVTDHHLAQDSLPDAYAIVNPNQPGDTSELGYLCGCGVGFYLIRGLCKKWIEKGSVVKFDLKTVLPYFAIATVTDMVPLVKDNRVLLKFAFESFRSVSNYGLKALMGELNLVDKKFDTGDIGLTLAPKINAISRMSDSIKPIDLFFQSSEDVAKIFAKDILKLNNERKQLQEAGLCEVKEAYEAYRMNENRESKQDPYQVFFYSSEKIHHGVTGLIASKMVENFGGSFFIGAHSQSTGLVVGSSRKSDKIDYSLVDMMAISKDSWVRFGGHANAAGFEYRKENQDSIQTAAQEYLTLLGKSHSAEHDLNSLDIKQTDISMPIDLGWFDLNTHFYTWVQFLEPFGSQFPEPIFRLKNVPVLSIKKMKEKHFKLNVVNPHNREPLNFILFNSTDEQRRLLNSLGHEFDISFKIKKDTFNYNQRFQFIIESLQASPVPQ